MVAGMNGRRRRHGPTCDATDLRRIVDAAGTSAGANALRDRALVAPHRFLGLRPEEILRLCWEDLSSDLTVNGRYGLTATLERAGRGLTLLLPGPSAGAVAALTHEIGGTVEQLSVPVFCARGVSSRPLSYRTARDIHRAACLRAGLPPVDAAVLRATCAHWLRAQGFSDHEVAAGLGLAPIPVS